MKEKKKKKKQQAKQAKEHLLKGEIIEFIKAGKGGFTVQDRKNPEGTLRGLANGSIPITRFKGNTRLSDLIEEKRKQRIPPPNPGEEQRKLNEGFKRSFQEGGDGINDLRGVYDDHHNRIVDIY